MRYSLVTVALLTLFSAPLYAGCEQDFKLAAGGVVEAAASGLKWTHCLLGQRGATCSGEAVALSWVDTLNRARGSEQGGIDNWRMPKIEELQALYVASSSCREELFPGFGAYTVWSASANIDYATDAWAFDFGAGEALVRARDSKLRVLLVSGPN